MKLLNTLFIIFCLNLPLFAGYLYEEITTPHNLDSQVGGLDVLPNGNLVACFHRGEVMIYNPQTKSWKLFAEGLHEPLGILAISNHSVMVMQRPELTLIIDHDKDGEADEYKTFYDDFGMTGNYHEFAFGPVRDDDGNFYISLNVASNGASIRKEIRGEFINIGMPREDFYITPWKDIKKKAGRMYSRVPHRGWIMKISPEGKGTPISCGVRSPNGLGFDADGDLFIPDNQGDWLGTSKLHHIKKGRFHGHPASLIWRKDWDGRDPLDLSTEELDKMRTKAAVLFPQGILANSPTQPLLIDHNKFGPYQNQMLIGDMNFNRILRFIKDRVKGEVQGALISHLEGPEMRIGNNRLAWGKDGSLYIGRTKLSWAGDRGITRVTWDNKIDFDIANFALTKKGFEIAFTQPVSKITADNFLIQSYHYLYHVNYGSPRQEEKQLEIKNINTSKDLKTIQVEIDGLKRGKVIDFTFLNLKSKQGETLKADRLCYTLNQFK